MRVPYQCLSIQGTLFLQYETKDARSIYIISTIHETGCKRYLLAVLGS